MTWWQIALIAVLTVALAASWYRYSIARGKLRCLSELYLWVAPVFGFLLLGVAHDRAGLSVLAGVAVLHVIVIAVALWGLGGTPAFQSHPARLASALLIFGSVLVWVGAVTWPGSVLQSIAARRADHLTTASLFLLGALITLAGFAVLRTVLRGAGDNTLSQLGLISYLVGTVCWAIHLAFRATVIVSAAEQAAMTGVAPPWFQPLRAWSGVMYAIYMVMAYLAIAAYGAAMRNTGWAGKAWGRTFVIFGLVAATGFVARLVVFEPPLMVQFAPYAMGMLILRRGVQEGVFVSTPSQSADIRDAAQSH